MRKLKLGVGSLRVDSFEASIGRGPEIGTVHGNEGTRGCSGGKSCQITSCLTCLPSLSSPQPSCDPCSWQGLLHRRSHPLSVATHPPPFGKADAMKKLKLHMDALAVESFTTSNAMEPRGTVEAHNTLGGDSCGPENTCGPQTCGALYCVRGTDPFECGGGMSANCPSAGCPSAGCPGGSGLSCVGCTTYDFTQRGGDTCDLCASRESESPERCRCI